MASLETKRINSAARAFLFYADKHNSLVDLVAGMRGAQGIDIKTSDGGIMISFDSRFVTELHQANDKFQVDIDSSGVLITVASLSSDYPIFSVAGAATTSILADGSIIISNGGNTLLVDPSLITHDMGIKEISVCDGGTPKSMLVIASDPY